MKLLRLLLLLTFICLNFNTNAQNFDLVVILKHNIDLSQQELNANTTIQRSTSSFNANEFHYAYPNAKTPILQKYFYIQGYDNASTAIQILDSLNLFASITESETSYAICDEPAVVDEPLNNYALDMIDAHCAWSITEGDPTVFIGVADTEIDLNHPDLENQIENDTGSSSAYHPHGTAVSSVAIAQTNNNEGISGIGYQCKLKFGRITHTIGPAGAEASSIAVSNAI